MNELNQVLKELSFQGLINVLSNYEHVVIDTIEDLTDAQQVAQCNINDGLIDEIEFIIELSGE